MTYCNHISNQKQMVLPLLKQWFCGFPFTPNFQTIIYGVTVARGGQVVVKAWGHSPLCSFRSNVGAS